MTKNKSPILTLTLLVFLLIFSYFNSKTPENNQTSTLSQTSQTSEKVVVVNIVDGDTIDVKNQNNETERIRIIGINTPEKEQCFFNEANKKAEDILLNEEITLENDPTQDEKDRYGRTLAHIIVSGENYGETMIKEGFAKEYTYKKPYKYQATFQEAQAFAINNEIGLWGNCN
ncbi:MAG: thermonuclease family protein [Candidatus Gracilibacteria bacterium]|jgi:micrococcal nuclease|nr:thermonuclease family protein [Candidatus Gracilibacteria bacterium]